MPAITDLLDRVTDSTTGRPVISALAAPGKALAAASLNITDATNWTTNSAIHFSIYNTTTIGGTIVKDPTTQSDWKGTLAGTTISNLTLTGGSDRVYAAGAIIEITPTARFAKDLYDLLITLFNQDATLKPAPIQTALGLGAATLNGWNALGFAPNTVTALGNRSYSLVFNAQDLTATLATGMRLRTTRTTAAPNQCTNLNGTNQFWSKAAPAGMTFTNNFVASAWVKMSAYGFATIASRYNGTSGWYFSASGSGQVGLAGFNAGSANFKQIMATQSIPLNKWVHVAAQLDMTSATNSPTVNYVMMDGVDVPAVQLSGGTAPVALIQAGNLEIGSQNAGTSPWNGKIAQFAIYSAKITEAVILASMNQTLIGTETSLISAYSFSGNANDLNVSNANNLTANNGAAASTADAPFGGQADGTISTTLDYGIITKVVFSTNTTVTLQLPEGCTIPVSGTVASVVYSSNKAPYGFPAQKDKWRLTAFLTITSATTSNATYGSFLSSLGGWALLVPIGSWDVGWQAQVYSTVTTAVFFNMASTALTGLSAAQGNAISPYTHTAYSGSGTSTSSPRKVFPQALLAASTFVMYTNGASTGAGIDSNTTHEIFAEFGLL